ncbi:uncharacterized protein B0H18DRAFT_969283 [Fomitopsis serialis]|uniref:uncharacterized protein n=1 Tax=Fomitopsis serialis TaxID=139415 RepID=UPI00200797A7|nr:uncharacterized protein B0H18DRAFT_969283 [Neoantrodia serialis]KAH9937141.1 hypothetical protein B0H18DRAFT_969283 [Neoantrodia serialis]
MASTTTWNTLPVEMKLSVVDLLDFQDVKCLSLVNREAYSFTVPSIFRHVKIPDYEALRIYLSSVPKSHNQYIRRLHICTTNSVEQLVALPVDGHPVTDAVAELLAHCSQVEQLTLDLAASLHRTIIPVLTINHCGDEQRAPLSERLVVAIAASLPSLSQLSLDRITRSALHAPELVGVYPFVPVVAGDEDIPDHPLLGSELRLPSLLCLPTLRRLRIRDTHLGDPQWSSMPVACALEVLDLGSCYHASPDFNRECTERIMGNVGHTVDEFALNTALTPQTFQYAQHSETPLKRLRKIHLTPLFPVENVVDTLSTLVQCYEDDVLDICSALCDFLSLRAERGEQALYKHLTEITVKTVSDLADGLYGPFALDTKSSAAVAALPQECAKAVRELQDFLRDLRSAGENGPTSGPALSTSATDSDIEKPSPPQADQTPVEA